MCRARAPDVLILIRSISYLVRDVLPYKRSVRQSFSISIYRV